MASFDDTVNFLAFASSPTIEFPSEVQDTATSDKIIDYVSSNRLLSGRVFVITRAIYIEWNYTDRNKLILFLKVL